MLVYDQAYLALRNKYIVPLSKYSIKYNSLSHNNIKNILKQFTNVEKENDSYIYRFDSDELMKSLLGDIFLFYIRTEIHKFDLENINRIQVSSNWNIVTNYYYSFFLCGLLLRLCHRGNIFLDQKTKNKVEKVMRVVLHDEDIHLDSNLFYEVIHDGDFLLRITKGTSNTHEIVWNKTYELFTELYSFAKEKTIEKDLLCKILKMNNDFSNTFPSQLRNRVNYQLMYGPYWLDDKFHSINSSINWLNQIFSYVKNRNSTSDDNKTAKLMFAYTKYIEYLCNNLIGEYFGMHTKQNGVIKKLNEKISTKIVIPTPRFNFDLT